MDPVACSLPPRPDLALSVVAASSGAHHSMDPVACSLPPRPDLALSLYPPLFTTLTLPSLSLSLSLSLDPRRAHFCRSLPSSRPLDGHSAFEVKSRLDARFF